MAEHGGPSIIAEKLLKKIDYLKIVNSHVHFKEDFKDLELLVKDVKPILQKLQPSQEQGDPDIKSWLEELKECLTEAEGLMKNAFERIFQREVEKRLHGLLYDRRINKVLLQKPSILYDEVRDFEIIRQARQPSPINLQPSRSKSNQKLDEMIPSTSRTNLQPSRRHLQPVQPPVFGREDVTEMVIKMICDSDIKKIGIYGMGGVGKTTVVQKINNHPQVQTRFGKHIYWLTLSQKPDIPKQQSKLYEKIEKEKIKFDTKEEGKAELFNLLHERHCLLILDDVWEKKVLEWMDVVSSSYSKLIVTTRKSDILTNDIHKIAMTVLSYNDSRSLFCHHAFKDRSVPIEIENYVKIAVDECKGLPLALKVIGSTMHNKTQVQEWEDACKRLQDVQVFDRDQDDALYDRLKISYDELGDLQKKHIDIGINLQECFLYLAAFPEDFWIPIPLLKNSWAAQQFVRAETEMDKIQRDCGLVLKILMDSSLVECGFLKTHIKTHDVIRDLAIRISEKERPKLDLFLPRWRTETEMFPIDICWQEVQRISLMNNKISFLPPAILLAPNLTLLESSFSSLKEFPMVEQGSFPSLRFLNLSSCCLDEFLQVIENGLDKLQRLQLHACESLKKLPSSFGMPFRLSCLKILDLSACDNLKDFPEVEENGLDKLQELDLSMCYRLQRLPSSFGKPNRLSCLERLDLSMCRNFMEFPDVEERGLDKLRKLELSECINLQGLPSSFGKRDRLSCLEMLNLSFVEDAVEVEWDELPEVEEHGLNGLRKLDLSGHFHLKRLPLSFGKARRLSCLEVLDLSRCWELKEFPEVEENGLDQLRKLNLSECSSLRKLPSSFWKPDRLSCLEILDFSLSDPELEDEPSESCLEILDFSLSDPELEDEPSEGFLQEFPEVEENVLTQLQELNISGRPLRRCLSSIGKPLHHSSLKLLYLSHCYELEIFPDVKKNGLNQLQKLDLSYCYSLKELPSSFGKPGHLSSLETLNLSNCSRLEEFPEVEENGLNQLRELNLTGCSLRRLPSSIGKPLRLSSLELLDLTSCHKLEMFPDVKKDGLNQLRKLDFSYCRDLKELPSSFGEPGRLSSLETLNLTGCDRLEEFPEVEENGLNKLQKIDLSYCYNLKELPSSFREPDRLSSLKTLNLRGCDHLEESPEVEENGLNKLLKN